MTRKIFISFALFFAFVCALSAADVPAHTRLDAMRGDAEALFRLGEIYEKGEGVPADKARAFDCYLAAAKRGNAAAVARVKALGGNRYLPSSLRDAESWSLPPRVPAATPGASAPAAASDAWKTLSVDCGNGVKMELLRIPAGMVTMGSPESEEGRYSDEKQVRVNITKPFYLGKTEVTQAQYQAVVGSNPSYFKGVNLPVECVSWDDAMAFCEKLTSRARAAGTLPAGWKFTLPTEAQWEYACRAGTTTRFYTGNSELDLSRAGWWDGNSDGKTHVVGQKQANAWGLYDMHGNVWEWCLDKSGSQRVSRGGCWSGGAQYCRSADRSCFAPGARYGDLGFRVSAVQE